MHARGHGPRWDRIKLRPTLTEGWLTASCTNQGSRPCRRPSCSIPVCSIQAILLALDRKDRERETVSVLLAELHPKVLSEEQISEGFTAIMLSCEASPTQQRNAHPRLQSHIMLWNVLRSIQERLLAGFTASCEAGLARSVLPECGLGLLRLTAHH